MGKKPPFAFIGTATWKTELTYADLDTDTGKMAAWFAAAGIGKGDRVILFLPKSVGFLVAHLALLRIGAISVPVNPGFRQAEMAYLTEDTRPSLIVAGSAQAGILKALDPKLDHLILEIDPSYENIDFFRFFYRFPGIGRYPIWRSGHTYLYLRNHGKTQRSGPDPGKPGP